MIRFMTLTFGFLGWAFYEMSGGADFEPVSAKMAAMIPQAQTTVAVNASPKSDAPAKVVAKVVPVDTTPPGFGQEEKDEEVSRVSINLTSVKVSKKPQASSMISNVSYVPVNVGSTISSADTPAIIPSLIVPNDSGAVLSNANASGDIRSIAGNRVNVRGGPGTDYGVVTKLGRGDSVEILQDDGDGWVKMRPLDGGPEGWVADFLLTTG